MNLAHSLANWQIPYHLNIEEFLDLMDLNNREQRSSISIGTIHRVSCRLTGAESFVIASWGFFFSSSSAPSFSQTPRSTGEII